MIGLLRSEKKKYWVNMKSTNSIDDAFARLRQTGWYSLLEPTAQQKIAASAALLHFQQGNHIYNAGELGAGLFGLVDGSYDLHVPRLDGELVAVLNMSPGYWIGDLAILSGEPGLVTMQATSDSTLVHVPAHIVEKMVEDDPSMYREFYKISRQNTELALQVVAGLVAGKAENKILLRLILLDELNAGQDGWIDILREDLAGHLGLSYPSVHRVLKQHADDGIIELSYGRMRVLQRKKLLFIAKK